MANIVIRFKDGKERRFEHHGRAGGSYTKTLHLESGFAVVEDEYGKRHVFPAQDIAEITETPTRSW